MENENNQNYQNQNYKNNQNYLITEQDFRDSQVFYDDRQSPRDYSNNRDNQNNQESNEHKPPFDSKLAIIVVQIVMCTAIIAVCLVMKSFSADLFSEMKGWYAVNVEDKTSTKQVLDSSSSSSSSGSSSNASSGSSSSDNSSGSSSGQTSSNISSSSSTTSGAASSKSSKVNSTLVSAEGGPPEVVQNVFSFDVVKQTMAKTTGGTANSLTVPVKGTVSSVFGYRTDPISGVYSFHDGLDIAANLGTEIHAAADGIVETAASDTYYGNYLVIKHSNNFKTVYGHCSTLKASQGQTVRSGDVIALVGSTGRSTGPHLHFEVQIGGQKVNPTWLLGAEFQ